MSKPCLKMSSAQLFFPPASSFGKNSHLSAPEQTTNCPNYFSQDWQFKGLSASLHFAFCLEQVVLGDWLGAVPLLNHSQLRSSLFLKILKFENQEKIKETSLLISMQGFGRISGSLLRRYSSTRTQSQPSRHKEPWSLRSEEQEAKD